ncbi:MAG: glycoside hydrolase family 31 protein [Puniceicoccaceae bacterium]
MSKIIENQVCTENQSVDLLPGEKLWSGAVKEGHLMPLGDWTYSFDFYANNNNNQLQPLILSNKGLYVWSEEPFSFCIEDGCMRIFPGGNSVIIGRSGKTLQEAREFASANFFPPSGRIPDKLLFSKPQYNTWIEMTYYHSQQKVLDYARGIIESGLPPGVLMIDESWQEAFGMWEFHKGRFPDPKSMIDELHELGFKVMLWVVPFVTPDRHILWSELAEKKALLMDGSHGNSYREASEPAIIKWWNGYSACLDFTTQIARDWFVEQLDGLVKKYQVDGFKFDAADMDFYPDYALAAKDVTPNEHCRLYAEIGLKYSLNEFRACWKMAGQPLGQRLHDKEHSWRDLQTLIPHMVVENLSGYTFSCPDMIGGGLWIDFLPGRDFDQELVVRSAQCQALMPMMQVSVAPWRVLDSVHFNAFKKAVSLREQFSELIEDLAEQSGASGIPIMSNLEYVFPESGYADINDQFMVGDRLMVAPVVEKAFKRQVLLPPGNWTSDTDEVHQGPAEIEIDVPLDRLPYFTLIP